MSKRIIDFIISICLIISLSLLSGTHASAEEPAPRGYDLSMHSVSILSGETFNLEIRGLNEKDNVSVESSDSSIVSVQRNGTCNITCTGGQTGNAKIVVRIEKDAFWVFKKEQAVLECNVKVSPLAVSIRSVEKKIKVKVGATKYIHYNVKPFISGETPTFISENTGIVTVSSSGEIKGVRKGKTYVVARLKNGKFSRVKIVVKK
ncbi:MAG: Ig-like domain-containing protein [Lachnospiraceae bacterium]|nr:Ig-like domain-containing protein [Lachnospiraceae bacterium]